MYFQHDGAPHFSREITNFLLLSNLAVRHYDVLVRVRLKLKVTATQRHCRKSPVLARWRPI
jgi:hypothetical protein